MLPAMDGPVIRIWRMTGMSNVWPPAWPSRHIFIGGSLFLSLIIGIFLRMDQIDRQVILDDEWHSIHNALEHSYAHIASHITPRGACVPLSLFYKFLMETVGLEEWGLRGLQLFFGAGAVVVLPLVIRGYFSNATAILFSFLLAISPLHIFYSRFARPYSITVFLTGLAVFHLLRWSREGRPVSVCGYVLCSSVAIYFHLTSAFAVLPALGYLWIVVLWRRWTASRTNSPAPGVFLPTVQSLLIISLFLSAGLSIWIWPLRESLPDLMKVVGSGDVTVNSLTRAVRLLCGVAAPEVCLGVLFFLGVGCYRTFQRDRVVFGYLAWIIVFHLAGILLTNPYFIEVPLTFARYVLPILPMCMILVAEGLHGTSACIQSACGYQPSRAASLAASAVFAAALYTLYSAGPLPRIHGRVNSFTGHSVWQENYAPWPETHPRESDYFRSYISYSDTIPRFYRDLGALEGSSPIIEYPRMIPDHFNLAYFYQLTHHHPVLIGVDPNSAGLKIAFHEGKIRFRNLLNLFDPLSVRRGGATYIVVHKDLDRVIHFHEKFPAEIRETYERYRRIIDRNRYPARIAPEQELGVAVYDDFVAEKTRERTPGVIHYLRDQYGQPFYEDDLIVVFSV